MVRMNQTRLPALNNRPATVSHLHGEERLVANEFFTKSICNEEGVHFIVRRLGKAHADKKTNHLHGDLLDLFDLWCRKDLSP